MLTKLEVASARSSPPALALDDNGFASTDPLQILNIEGLGPVKADITTVPYSIFDGEAYSGGASVGKRNIVLTIGLNPAWEIQSYEELRKLLYAYFMPKLRVQLNFKSTHLPDVYIDGIIESIDPNMFSKDPQAQVSIICPIPDFIAKAYTVKNAYTVALDRIATVVAYNGSSPAGFKLKISKATSVSPGLSKISLVVNTELVNQVFRITAMIDNENYFEMSTVPGKKFVQSVNTHTGKPKSYLNGAEIGTGWPLLHPGDNNLLIITPVPGQLCRLEYYERFGGL